MKLCFRCISLLCLFSVAGVLNAQTRHMRLSSFGSGRPIDFRGLEKRTDLLALVQVREGQPPDARVYKQGERTGAAVCDSYTVTVVRSADWPAGTEITCTNAAFGQTKFEPLEPGIYLLLAERQREGALVFPQSFGDYDDKGEEVLGTYSERRVPSKSPSEQSILLLVGTDDFDLPELSNRRENIAAAVVRACAGAPAEERGLLFRFVVGGLRDPNLDKSPRLPTSGDSWSKFVKTVADELPPLDRARLYSTLVFWEVMGSEQGFIDAVSAAAKEERGLVGEDAILGAQIYFARPNERGVPGDYPFRPTAEDFVGRALASRSPEATQFFIRNIPGTPERKTLKDLAGLLESSNTGVRAEVVKFFCAAVPDAPVKIQYSTSQGKSVIANQDELEQYWRRYFEANRL